MSWNQNVLQLLRVFSHLTGMVSPLTDAIFFSSKSDATQRRMVLDVAAVVGLAPEPEKVLRRLVRRLEEAAVTRNLATHVIFGVSPVDPGTGAWNPTMVPALSPRQDRRLREDFATQFRELERKLDATFRELEDWLVHTPFPPRPWGHPPFPGLPGPA